MPLWKDWGPTYKEGWCCFFNLPREVRMLEDGTLKFLPAAETESLRQDPQYRDVLVVTDAGQELNSLYYYCFCCKDTKKYLLYI